jgi:hypothetical protein
MSIPALRAWRVSSSHANRALVKKLTIQLFHLALAPLLRKCDQVAGISFLRRRISTFMAQIFFTGRQRLFPGVITPRLAVLIYKHGRALPDAF